MLHHQRFAVGVRHDGVRAVLAAAALEAAQQLDLVQLAAGFRGADAIQAAAPLLAVDHDVEAVKGPQQTLRLADVHGQFLDLNAGRSANRRGRDAVEAAVLVRDDQPALRIDAHGDPRALRLARHRVEQLDPEILGDLDALGGRGLSLCGGVRGCG